MHTLIIRALIDGKIVSQHELQNAGSIEAVNYEIKRIKKEFGKDVILKYEFILEK